MKFDFRKFYKLLDCTAPPPIPNGKYNENLAESYRQGQIINGFQCDPGFLPTPSDGLIECGSDGWLKKAFCEKGKTTCSSLTNEVSSNVTSLQ